MISTPDLHSNGIVEHLIGYADRIPPLPALTVRSTGHVDHRYQRVDAEHGLTSCLRIVQARGVLLQRRGGFCRSTHRLTGTRTVGTATAL